MAQAKGQAQGTKEQAQLVHAMTQVCKMCSPSQCTQRINRFGHSQRWHSVSADVAAATPKWSLSSNLCSAGEAGQEACPGLQVAQAEAKAQGAHPAGNDRWVQHAQLQVRQGSMSAFGSEEGTAEARAAGDRLQAAQAELAELQNRVDRERQAFAQISANMIASSSHIDIQARLAVTRQHLQHHALAYLPCTCCHARASTAGARESTQCRCIRHYLPLNTGLQMHQALLTTNCGLQTTQTGSCLPLQCLLMMTRRPSSLAVHRTGA